MAFTDIEIEEPMKVLEDSFWSRRRPLLHLRDQVREGQRFTNQVIELLIVRPAFNRPGEHIEESIAKVQYVLSRFFYDFVHDLPPEIKIATRGQPVCNV